MICSTITATANHNDVDKTSDCKYISSTSTSHFPSRDEFIHNPLGKQWYFIDTISPEKIIPVLYNDVQYAITKTFNFDDFDAGNPLENPNFYILTDELCSKSKFTNSTISFINEALKSQQSLRKIISEAPKSRLTNKSFELIELRVQPRYYIYILVQGDMILTSILPIVKNKWRRPYELCNLAAYYNVLIPVW